MIRNNDFGFTLLELIITLSIIIAICALLIGSVAVAKESSRKISCTTNHKNLSIAWSASYLDNKDEFLPNQDMDINVGNFTNWVAGNLQEPTYSDRTNYLKLVDRNLSLISANISEHRVFKCPSDVSKNVRSISMNNRINPIKSNGKPSYTMGHGEMYKTYRVISDVGDPSNIFVFIDERDDSINEGYFAVDLSNTGNPHGLGFRTPYYIIDTPGSYHKNMGILSFVDGHVESKKWIEKSTLGPKNKTGPRFTKADDKDISWLQKRTSEAFIDEN